ncbi:MAG TPA: GNAT family N-acetyltransferase [Flavisolibacter sp.]|jgi:RimJ/RimL family protein N-acetyltransferase|nr:GNAT family N-acetyltransferase [Flavisolibacter sp.]
MNGTQTGRLRLEDVSADHAAFIRELVNTSGWLTFIGERNVRSDEDAVRYITGIRANPDINYWVVHLKESGSPVGIVSFIKRNYLDHHDIGFAFLPEHMGKGYAYEASKAVLEALFATKKYEKILATSMKENYKSIALLTKLGFHFAREIEVGPEQLRLYEVSS